MVGMFGISSGYVNIAIENGHLEWIYPLKIVIFHSYVSLPEDILQRYVNGSKSSMSMSMICH
jgi:hypothetical protein